MATNDDPQRAERPKVNVKFDEGLELDVNAATLELLQRRIESQVMSSILKTFGIPVASTSIVAIVIAAALWIPAQVKSIVDSQMLKDYFANSVKNYLEADNQGKPFFRGQIETSVASYFVKGTGRQELETILKSQLSDEQIKDILKKAVNEELRAVADNSTSQISENLQAHITTTTERVDSERKGSRSELEIFLDRQETKEAGAQGRPLMLEFEVGLNDYYSSKAIDDYVREIKRRFPKSDVYFLLKQLEGKTFVALCGPVVPKPNSRQQFDLLIAMLMRNWDDLETAQSAVRDLNIFPTVITERLHDAESLGAAMRSKVWRDPDNIKAKVAVVNSMGKFVGTTTRERIIEALLKI